MIKRVKQSPAPSYSYHLYEKSSYFPLKTLSLFKNVIRCFIIVGTSIILILKLIKIKTIAKLKYCKIVIFTNIDSVSSFLDLCFSQAVKIWKVIGTIKFIKITTIGPMYLRAAYTLKNSHHSLHQSLLSFGLNYVKVIVLSVFPNGSYLSLPQQ